MSSLTTATRQNLGKRIYCILKQYKEQYDGRDFAITFTTSDPAEGKKRALRFQLQKYGADYVGMWLDDSAQHDLMGVRITPSGVCDAVSEFTTEEDLVQCLIFMEPVDTWWIYAADVGCL